MKSFVSWKVAGHDSLYCNYEIKKKKKGSWAELSSDLPEVHYNEKPAHGNLRMQ